MARALSAALIYAIIVFAIGFALGVIRNLVLIPRVGVLPAVLIELPFILLASWVVVRRVVAHARVPAQISTRLVMGLVALAILTLFETLTAYLLFGLTMSVYLAGYLTVTGLPGLLGQLLYALFPVLLLLGPGGDRGRDGTQA